MKIALNSRNKIFSEKFQLIQFKKTFNWMQMRFSKKYNLKFEEKKQQKTFSAKLVDEF